MIKNFAEYIEDGTVRRITIDKQRAKSLVLDSERKLKVLDRQVRILGIDKELANEYILLCYDSLMLVVRAGMLLNGYNASGIGAHEAEVSYITRFGFNEKEIRFLDQMRYFRNGMLYYGTILDEEYAQKVIVFTKKAYSKLKDKLNLK